MFAMKFLAVGLLLFLACETGTSCSPVFIFKSGCVVEGQKIFEEIFCPVYPEGCEDLAQDVTPSYQFSDSLPSLPTHGVFVPKPLISEPANPEHLVNLPTRKKRPSMNGRKKGIKPRRKHWKQRKRARKTKISGNSVKSRQLKPKGSVHNPNENKSMRDTKSESHSTLSTIVVNPTFFTSPPVPDAKETQIEVQTTPPPTLNDISLEDIPPTTSEKLVVVPFTSEDAAPSNARRSMEVSKQKWEETTAPSSIESEESSSLAVKAVDFASVKANSSKSSEKEAEETNSSESLTSTTVATGPVSVTLETSAKIHTTEPPTPHLQLSTYEETTGSAQISKTTTLLRGHRDEQPPNHSTQADMIEHESSTVAESSHHFEYSSGYYESGKGPKTFYDASGNFYEGSGNFYEASGGYYDVSYYENQEESSGNFNPDEHYEERRSFESKGENKMNTIGSALDIPPLPNRRVPPKQNAGNANPPDNVLKELYSIEKIIAGLQQNISHMQRQHMTLGTILRVKPGQRTLLAFDELQKDVKEIRGNTIVCKNSSLICTEVYTFGKSVCTEYEDCPTWPCQLTPDCSVSYQLDVDCLEWDCKDSKQEGTMNYYWLGFVAFVVILSIFTLLVLIKVYRKRNQSSREVLSSEPRVRATQEESRPFLAWLKKTKSFFSRDPQDETTAGQYPLEEGFFQGGESYGSFDAVPQTNVFGKYDTRSLPEETEFFNIDA